jgi:hypothetical protein
MKINAFNASRFRNAEFISLVTDVLNVAREYDWVGLQVEGFYTKTKGSLKKMEDHLNKFNTVPETIIVDENDFLFNNSWWAFKFFCNALALNPDMEKSKAANLLINLSKIHGYNLHTESHQEQNAKAKMFLADCDGVDEVKEAIELIGANPFITNIKIALDALVLSIDYRNGKSAKELRDTDTKVLRVALTEHLDQMLKYMEAMSGLAQEGPLIGMIKNINERIQKIEVLHKTRLTRSADQADELQ